MNKNAQIHPNLIMVVFVTQAVLNWLYILWVKSMPIINNAWFVMLPLIGFFYFTFTFIASIWIVSRKTIGLNFAYCILMAGSSLDVLSYSLIVNHGGIIEMVMLPLIVMNICVVFYLASKQKYFSKN